MLLLDAGDSLYGDRTPAKTTEGADSVQVMNMLSYDAMALGAGDLFGTEIVKRMEEANFPILSANLYHAETRELLAPPYVLRQIGGQTVAIVGLSEPFTRTGYIVSDPVSTVEAAVQELGSQASVILLLSHAGPQIDAQIARQVSGIDVIVGSSLTPAQSPVRDPAFGTILLYAETPASGVAGRYIGQGTFHFDAQGTLTNFEWTRIVIAEEIAEDPNIARWVAEKSLEGKGYAECPSRPSI